MAECYSVSFIRSRPQDRMFGMNGALYYSRDEINVNEMSRSCAAYGEKRNA